MIIIGSVVGGLFLMYGVYLVWANKKIKNMMKYIRDYESKVEYSEELSETEKN